MTGSRYVSEALYSLSHNESKDPALIASWTDYIFQERHRKATQLRLSASRRAVLTESVRV